MPNDPILRSEFLKPLSREHHHGLLLCWKIRTGLRKGVSARRIKAFADWFFEGHLKKHFEVEEDKVFPLLGLNHPMVEKALKDHRRLRRLFAEKEQIDKSLGLLEEELEDHIRYEERILFREIEKVIPREDALLMSLVTAEEGVLPDNWEDKFWE